MSQQAVATRVEHEPAWPPTLTPYIVVSGARRVQHAANAGVQTGGSERSLRPRPGPA